MLLVLLVTRKRLGLVIRLFEEAGRAISDMPTLLILPWVVSFFNKTMKKIDIILKDFQQNHSFLSPIR
jgi:hypothetical protein